ncbi:MAG: HVO_0476 family zinc finger protein [Halobacteria archaeon]|nr:HVO_0476 family zinc finger protein [Halobacteria archaeon]
MEAQVVVGCPSCGRTPHRILKRNGQATVKCTECGHVHKVKVHEPEQVERRVIVSQGEESFSTRVPVDSDEHIEVGDEFVLESDEGIFGVEVTSLEISTEDDPKRVESTTGEEVDTVWTRVVDNVVVDVTLHGSKGESRGVEVHVPGDYRFVVGEREELDGYEFEVTAFITRDGNRFRVEGDDVLAKNAKRIYGEER